MSDTPVTLYRMDLVKQTTSGRRVEEIPSHEWQRLPAPVGEFVSRSWCAEHGAEGIGGDLEYCWHGYYLLGDPAVGTLECDMVEILVQVIPDDPKEK